MSTATLLGTAAQVDRTLTNLQRRLEKWELQHLRQHATELSERLDHALDDAERGWEAAEFWRENAMELQQELMEEGAELGLTKGGQIVLLKGTTSQTTLDVLFALQMAESFIAGFEGDPLQEGINDLLIRIRTSLATLRGDPQPVADVVAEDEHRVA